jgi:hypothetical protein
VPVQVVQVRLNQPGVFVAEDGKARWRTVQVGVRGRDRIEIVTGLKAGERVVTARVPQTVLRDGNRIAVP